MQWKFNIIQIKGKMKKCLRWTHIVQKRAEMDFESCDYEIGVGGTGEMCLDQGYQHFLI